MSADKQQLHITILTGSGTEELTGIEGELTVTQQVEQHHYDLNYTIEATEKN